MADLTITATSVVATGAATIGDFTAGAAITAGQTLYLASDGTVNLYDANSGTAAARDFLGIALNGAASGQPVKVAKAGTTVTIGATVANGVAYYGSATAGGICPFADLASGAYPTLVGIGLNTTQIKIIGAATGTAL